MVTKEFDDLFDLAKTGIDRTIDNALKKGYQDSEQAIDDYSVLLQTAEFRNLVIVELYENYFFPNRHVFELQILRDLVEAVAKLGYLRYVLSTASPGSIGNAAYDLSKKILNYVAAKFIAGNDDKSSAFLKIRDDICMIQDHFNSIESDRVEEIEKNTGIERARLTPLLKLLGFQCDRTNNIWLRQD